MYVATRTTHYGEVEFFKWIVLAMLAAAFATLLATQALGVGPAPQTLPPDVEQWAQPMQPLTGLHYPEEYPLPTRRDPQQVVWQILELHRRGLAEEAIAAWQTADLPCGMDGWKQLALAAAHLQTGNADGAHAALTAAEAMQPEPALLHYYTALLRLTEARGARNWLDTLPRGDIMLLAMLPQVAPNTQGMYELAAMAELERAIELAPLFDPDVPLVPWTAADPNAQPLPLITPTAGDLLTALGADHFATRARQLLGGLYLDHGRLEEAEARWDEVVADDVGLVPHWRELARAFEAQGRPADAARVYHKAFTQGDANLVPALRYIENLWQQWWEDEG